MSATLEFYFDFISPYTYLAATQIEELAQRKGARLVYRPVFLGGIFKETGNHPPIDIIKKGVGGQWAESWCSADDTSWTVSV